VNWAIRKTQLQQWSGSCGEFYFTRFDIPGKNEAAVTVAVTTSKPIQKFK